ncbi:hypothetical protein ACF8Q9_08295 [Pseudomonas sp. TYF_15]|uniref:hypothetical protein n=1 Tax=Pseudomonas sp. TYF_15 TaxID=3367194 RepID=UPI00370C722F
MIKVKSCLAFVLLSTVGGVVADEEAHPTKSSAEFESSANADLTALINSNFQDGLVSQSLGASTKNEYEASLGRINESWKQLVTYKGDPKVQYDVILQAGHYRRLKGATGAQGANVSEMQLSAYIVSGIAKELAKSNTLKVLVVPADGYERGLNAKIFLAVHADGSVKPCSTGPSLSYQKSSSTLAMHAIGWGLSQALGYKYEDFRKDGFTVDAAHYYMYSKVDAPVMKGLLEIGEVTCPKEESRLIVGADGIAVNVARAISFVLDSASVKTAVAE